MDDVYGVLITWFFLEWIGPDKQYPKGYLFCLPKRWLKEKYAHESINDIKLCQYSVVEI